MAIWGCCSPAHCCQSALAGGFIYAALRSELNTHLAPQALFNLEFSWAQRPLLQAFPFPSTLGEVTLHPLSHAGVFIYSLCLKWVFPPLLWNFLPTATFTSFPTPGCWACAAAPAFSSWLGFVRDFPSPPLQWSEHPTLFATCLFCCYYLFSFFSFFPLWGSVCPGGYADLVQGYLWEYCVLFSSPCSLLLPKWSGHWCLMAREPSWFLHLTWSWDAICGLGVWRSQSFASSQWFFL
jgi:hypothetical protein